MNPIEFKYVEGKAEEPCIHLGNGELEEYFGEQKGFLQRVIGKGSIQEGSYFISKVFLYPRVDVIRYVDGDNNSIDSKLDGKLAEMGKREIELVSRTTGVSLEELSACQESLRKIK